MTDLTVLGTFSYPVDNPVPEQPQVYITITISIEQNTLPSPVKTPLPVTPPTGPLVPWITCNQGDVLYWSVSAQGVAYTPEFTGFEYLSGDNVLNISANFPTTGFRTTAQNTGTESVNMTFNWFLPDDDTSILMASIGGEILTVDPYISCN